MGLFKIYTKLIQVLLFPFFLQSYFAPATGREYGIGLVEKIYLAWEIRQATNNIQTETSYLEIMTMATTILQQPASIEGCIVECGCFKGGTTASLSLVAESTGKVIHAFDSFSGLPDSEDSEIVSPLGIRNREFVKGEFESSLEETRTNVETYGCLSHCELHPGLFEETLSEFEEPCSFVYTDVDLRDSLEQCIRELWPLLQEGGYLYTHEAHHEEIASLFFDKEWWQAFGYNPPALIGSGTGIGLHPMSGSFVSQIGYTVKRDHEDDE